MINSELSRGQLGELYVELIQGAAGVGRIVSRIPSYVQSEVMTRPGVGACYRGTIYITALGSSL